jgi:hypothetical protein
MLSAWSINLSDLIDNPTPQKVWNMVSAVTTGLDTKYDRNFTEAGLQALIEYALRELQDRSAALPLVCVPYARGKQRRAKQSAGRRGGVHRR